MAAAAHVALVNMPWGRTGSPSIQCGLLKSILVEAGHEVDVHYVNLLLANHVGPESYADLLELSGPRHHMVGEWLFTKAAFGEGALPPEKFFAASAGRDGQAPFTHEVREHLAHLHEQRLPDFLQHVVDRTDWGRYDIVGFTSTFEQNVASIALARLIKDRFPGVTIVFGGANVDGDMGAEFLRVVDSIDVVVRGEGERTFPALVNALMSTSDLGAIPGVLFKRAGIVQSAGEAPLLPSLDIQPVPDYSEYFDLLKELGQQHMLKGRRPWVPFESSRGCWWGAKHHCTFCGLNALGLQYRTKSVERVIAELLELSRRHQTLRFEAVDNIIDHASMNELCEELATTGYDFSLFYEVKANLSRDQLAMLRRAGLRSIQPGIESLSTHVLTLMNKGSTRLINLRLLKWAQYYGLEALWAIITGFPGETSADYASQTALIPLLHHLRPPLACQPLWMERFSPYFTQADRGFTNIRPQPGYFAAYPIDGIDYDKIAYFFDYDVTGVGTAEDLAKLQSEVSAWQAAWKPPSRPPVLHYFEGPGWIRIVDTRSGHTRKTTLEGDEIPVFAGIVDTFHSIPALQERLARAGRDLSASTITAILTELIDAGFAIEENGHYFALALPARRQQ